MAADPDPLDLVARLIAAIEAGELGVVRSLYSPEAVVWTCFDDRERDVDGSMRVLEWLVGSTTERRYDVTRRIAIDGGVLQQHVLHATTHAGKTFSMPACLVVHVDGDHVARVDEYLDPTPAVGAMG